MKTLLSHGGKVTNVKIRTTLASDLVLNTSEKSSIQTSISTLESRLSSYFDDIKEKFCFGSYTRAKTKRRKDIEVPLCTKNIICEIKENSEYNFIY